MSKRKTSNMELIFIVILFLAILPISLIFSIKENFDPMFFAVLIPVLIMFAVGLSK